MTISLSNYRQLSKDEPQPFSEGRSEYNQRERAVYCDVDKYFTYTKLAGPKCGICGWALITVVYSDVELAQPNSQSA